MQPYIRCIAYHLPERIVTNADLAAEFPGWTAEKIEAKTGIQQRRVSHPGECASDLAVEAARKIIDGHRIKPADIDFLIFCTQSPDHLLPTTACLIHQRLALPVACGALDFNLGCSGFVYGLSLAQGMIVSGQARKVLLLTADTYNRYIDPSDRGLRVLFGDGAAATLVSADDTRDGVPWPFVFGTDGAGACNLKVEAGGMRTPLTGAVQPRLYMNGPEIFNFTLQVIPGMVDAILTRNGMVKGDVDLFVFHQANQFMLEHLRRHLDIPAERFVVNMQHCGNTVSASIPIALAMAEAEGRLRPGMKVMLVGFGVGYSWGATIIEWHHPVANR